MFFVLDVVEGIPNVLRGPFTTWEESLEILERESGRPLDHLEREFGQSIGEDVSWYILPVSAKEV